MGASLSVFAPKSSAAASPVLRRNSAAAGFLLRRYSAAVCTLAVGLFELEGGYIGWFVFRGGTFVSLQYKVTAVLVAVEVEQDFADVLLPLAECV